MTSPKNENVLSIPNRGKNKNEVKFVSMMISQIFKGKNKYGRWYFYVFLGNNEAKKVGRRAKKIFSIDKFIEVLSLEPMFGGSKFEKI